MSVCSASDLTPEYSLPVAMICIVGICGLVSLINTDDSPSRKVKRVLKLDYWTGVYDHVNKVDPEIPTNALGDETWLGGSVHLVPEGLIHVCCAFLVYLPLLMGKF